MRHPVERVFFSFQRSEDVGRIIFRGEFLAKKKSFPCCGRFTTVRMQGDWESIDVEEWPRIQVGLERFIQTCKQLLEVMSLQRKCSLIILYFFCEISSVFSLLIGISVRCFMTSLTDFLLPLLLLTHLLFP